ncbi:MAG: nucleotidyl transferase AbiEii/AbiGii toxin family protein [Desulfobulbaceae bacterium]|nr:nucleotidyl transferase AbiEii/AbiGii toxin family protein [Desulfobulbaceae bacterium]HIJ78596.1 nucleotidyl transferase AbiEii/AbiGii toxin family protein [Deltaproteobacteria bacterium]
MDLVAKLSDSERKELFFETAARKGMTPAVVEKDFWVTWTLGKIFINPELNSILKFKGGTSLSKVYKLIERFSEDIDLILNWEILTGEDPQGPRSKTKQAKFNKEIDELGRSYIAGELLQKVSGSIEPICHCEVAGDDPNVLNLFYPKAFPDEYIRPEIRLEIGPLASWLPFEKHTIKSYAAEAFPHLFKKPECLVQVIKAERTFWEKVTILHHEAHRPEGNAQPSRNSRHYYDLAKMALAPVKNSALADIAILYRVAEFKQRFYPRSWARYDLAKPGTVSLVPKGHVLESVKDDYKAMRNMIYGVYPDFKKIYDVLEELESEINSL